MSDPVIKGVKRPSPRPATNVSSKSSAKSRKVASSASSKRIAKRTAAAEKAPVRKASRSKTTSGTTASKATRVATSKRAKTTPQPKKKAARKPLRAAPVKKAARPATKQTKKGKPTATAAKARTTKSVAKSRRPTGAPAPPHQPTRDEAAALRAFERAHKEFSRGRFAEARMLFRALIEQHRGVAEVTARARTYLAIAEARLRSESAPPRDAESLYDRGVIELNRGEYVAAQEMFERALKREPAAADIHYALAATRARLGSIEMALQSLERALDLKPNLRVRAQHDPDLVALRNEPDFERLVFPASRL
jgi:tetratricopeptide (TPR) repeat protein